MKYLVYLSLVLTYFLFFAPANQAQPVENRGPDNERVVLGALPALKRNTRGGGGTLSVIEHIFHTNGIEVEVMFVPTLRLTNMLLNDKVDIFIFPDTKVVKDHEEVLRSALPFSLVTFDIYYNKNNGWTPVWPPDDAFKQRIGKSQIAHRALAARYHMNITDSASHETIVKMINRGRADYWIEHRNAMQRIDPKLFKLSSDGFVIEPLYQIGQYAWFKDDVNGRHLHEILKQGQIKLLEEGRYKQVYNPTPGSGSEHNVNELIKFVLQTHPEINVVPQLEPVF